MPGDDQNETQKEKAVNEAIERAKATRRLDETSSHQSPSHKRTNGGVITSEPKT